MVAAGLACGCAAGPHGGSPVTPPTDASLPAVEAARGAAKPPFRFSPEDERLLDDVQRGAFRYFWEAASPDTGMVYDRSSKTVVSIAGVGFQLSALPIGVERGWVTRREAHERALLILRTLSGGQNNRKAGLFYHYLDPRTAEPSRQGYEVTVSTIDSALLLAGVITASSYFGGPVQELGDRLVSDADWSFFILRQGDKPFELGFVSLGFKPDDPAKPAGPGGLLPYVWADAGDEHRLVTLLGVCAPVAAHRLDPDLYYRLRRPLGAYAGSGPFVWLPWSGALFTYFFAHCWIDYAAIGADNPAAFGVAHRARVDWWENSRRAVQMHRRKAVENPEKVPTLGENAWGLSASDAPGGYAVPGLFPDPLPMPGAVPQFDYSTVVLKDDYGDGTVAPYAAGSAIMFDPGGALAALRYYQGLSESEGKPLVWRDPRKEGASYGFLDSFNLGKRWVASDYVAIDQGPLLLAIENARTGLIWRLFHRYPAVRAGMDRLGLAPAR